MFEQGNADGRHSNSGASVATPILIADVEEEVAEGQDREGVVLRLAGDRHMRDAIGQLLEVRALQGLSPQKQRLAFFDFVTFV